MKTLILAAFMALLTQGKKPFRFTDETIAHYVDDIFFTYDANEDGFLDRNESLRFYRDANNLTPTQPTDQGEFAVWQDLIDANNDGRLSWEELYTLAGNAE